MDRGDLIIALIAAAPGLIAGTAALVIAIKKTKYENAKLDAEADKTEAETASVYQQVSDRWAEHVKELQDEIKGLRLDISQVRRENEEYRQENADLRDWAERLIRQLAKHAPGIAPEPYIRRDKR